MSRMSTQSRPPSRQLVERKRVEVCHCNWYALLALSSTLMTVSDGGSRVQGLAIANCCSAVCGRLVPFMVHEISACTMHRTALCFISRMPDEIMYEIIHQVLPLGAHGWTTIQPIWKRLCAVNRKFRAFTNDLVFHRNVGRPFSLVIWPHEIGVPLLYIMDEKYAPDSFFLSARCHEEAFRPISRITVSSRCITARRFNHVHLTVHLPSTDVDYLSELYVTIRFLAAALRNRYASLLPCSCVHTLLTMRF